MSDMVKSVGVDKTCYSLSFNEYLTLVSLKRREEPRDNSLLSSFRSVLITKFSSKIFLLDSLFDKDKSGTISCELFRQILKTKHVSDGDIAEMIEGESPFHLLHRNIFLCRRIQEISQRTSRRRYYRL